MAGNGLQRLQVIAATCSRVSRMAEHMCIPLEGLHGSHGCCMSSFVPRVLCIRRPRAVEKHITIAKRNHAAPYANSCSTLDACFYGAPKQQLLIVVYTVHGLSGAPKCPGAMSVLSCPRAWSTEEEPLVHFTHLELSEVSSGVSFLRQARRRARPFPAFPYSSNTQYPPSRART